MIIPEITINNILYYNVSREDLVNAGVDADVVERVIADAEQAEQAQQNKRQMRREIQQDSGDLHSLVGTAADGLCYLLYEQGKFLHTLSEAQSLAEVRAAAAPLATTLGDFAQAVDAGEIQLPYQHKPTAVLEDVAARATEVAHVLAAHAVPAAE